MSILERLRDSALMEQMSLGEKLWGALVVTIVGMVVCMIALTAIMYAIKLMHLIFREKVADAAPAKAEQPAPPVLPDAPDDAAILVSPQSGKVSMLNCREGVKVDVGDVLLLLDVGSSTYEVPAPAAGTVVSLCVKAGDTVAAGGALLIFREKEDN